jgi:anti-sigma B factor antagonist
MAGAPALKVLPRTAFELTVVDLDPLRAAICAVGEFDLAARDDLAEALQKQETARRRIVRIDLSQVTFLDCSCLGVIVASHHRLLKLRGLLVLTGVDAAVARILKITGLEDHLFIVPADQDPFGSLLMARATRASVPKQRLASAPGFDSLTADADRLGVDATAMTRKAVS